MSTRNVASIDAHIPPTLLDELRLDLERQLDKRRAARVVVPDDGPDDERDQLTSAAARNELLIAELEHALTRVDDGTYGVCTQCGEPIPIERLEALPSSPFCRGCADPRS